MKILILAAGRSSRFKGIVSKVLFKFWGNSVIDILLSHAKRLGAVTIMTNSENNDAIKHDNKIIQDSLHYGTGAAVQQYTKYMNEHDNHDLLIIPGDLPLMDVAAMEKICAVPGDIVVGVMKMPQGAEQYGRIILDEKKSVQAIIEQRFHEEKTMFANTGIMLIRKSAQHLIAQLKENSAKETYLTDIVELANKSNLKVAISRLMHESALGFNTVEELNYLLQLAQHKWRIQALKSDAIFYDINSVYFSHDTIIEQGAIIEPNCMFGPNVQIKSSAHIKAFSVLSDCIVDGIVGPFAHVKSGEIERYAHIGAFVEMSQAKVHKGAKIKHLAYIGNVEVGQASNIGAGVVICNYDGKNKHDTKIGKNVMVGANSSLVAPIEIGDNAFLAAGGVYTKKISDDEFAIARARQENKKKK